MSGHQSAGRMGARVLRAVGVFALCLLAALIATLPLVSQLADALPLGTEREATVPLFNLWTLWWNADRLGHGFAGYWDAPIFYPNPGTFTYSEPQPLTGLLVAPLWWLGAPPALIYNLALLLLLTLNGVFAYRLARALEVDRLPALLAALLTVTLPFVAKILGVLQLTALFGMLWTLDGLVRFGASRRVRSAVWAAAGILATFLTCQQYALLFAPFALIAGLVALGQLHFAGAAVVRLGAAGIAAAALVALIALPVIQVHGELGLERSDVIVRALSARPEDFFTRPDTALVPLPPRDLSDTGGLFPGLLLALLAIIGAAQATGDQRRRAWAWYMAGGVVLAAVLALGLNLTIGGWSLFGGLRAVVPGMAELRSPFRFAAVMQIFLPILAALALDELRRITPGLGVVIVVVLAVLAGGENLAVAGPLRPTPPTPRTAWTAWLRAQPERLVVAHVPFPDGVHVAVYELETWRMFAQIDHGQPLVNGYSGYFPQVRTPDGQVIPTYTQFQLAMARDFPNYPLMCVLTKSLGAQLLIADADWAEAHSEQLAAQQMFLRPAYSDDQVRIYALEAPSGECAAP